MDILICGPFVQYTGVVGAFNCQGGGWDREARRNTCASQYSKAVTSQAGPKDVEWRHGASPIYVEGIETFVLYSFKQKKLVLAKPTDRVQITLEPFNFELLTVSPVTILGTKSVQFAPIGLVNMLNTGGAIQSIDLDDEANSVEVEVKGAGEMRIFASQKPSACKINGEVVPFKYEDFMVAINIPWFSPSGSCVIAYIF